jgi:hypothetical protein
MAQTFPTGTLAITLVSNVRRMGVKSHREGVHLLTDPLFGAAEASLPKSHIRQEWGSGNGSSRMTPIERASESFKLVPIGRSVRGLCCIIMIY